MRLFPFYKPRFDAKARLFCLPCAGRGAVSYAAWAAQLAPAIEVIAIELPGRGTRMRDPLAVHVDSLVDEIAVGIAPLLDRPTALFGHSMGGTIAFELARRVGRGIQHVFVAAARTPETSLDPRFHSGLSDRELVAELERMGGTAPEVLASPELLELVLPILRSDLRVVESGRYLRAVKIPHPITAFAGATDDYVSVAEVEGWRKYTTAPFRLVTLPGDHFFIDGALPTLAAEIARDLSPR